ncbi:MAG: NADH-quinone oxidoreductase subunit M [Saprospiraceae bacterium]
MLTSTLIGFPFIVAIIILLAPKVWAKWIALVGTLLEFGLALLAFQYAHVNPADPSLMTDVVWIQSVGIHYKVWLDGISLVLVLLTSLLLPIIVYSTFGREITNGKAFYALVLIMQAALIGVFAATDGFLFYIFWEMALIPIYFICLLWGGENRSRITFKFFIYTTLGSLFMLLSLIFLYLQTPDRSFDVYSLYEAGRNLSLDTQLWVFAGIFLAFAIKMPLIPFHTWQPDTYYTSPTPGTMLLSGIMLKMGTYGLIRWLVPVVPAACQYLAPYLVGLSIASVIYGSFMAIAQKDYKRLIGYSSIAHVGLISAGIFSLTIQGMQGGLYQMLSHGIYVVGLFFVAEIIFTRTGTWNMEKLGGIRSVAPKFALAFLIILLGSVALPLTNGFVGEFLLINGIFQYNAWMAGVAGLTIIFGAVYMLRAYQAICLGEESELSPIFSDLTRQEWIVLWVICILIIGLGIFPQPLLDMAAPALQSLLESIQPTTNQIF